MTTPSSVPAGTPRVVAGRVVNTDGRDGRPPVDAHTEKERRDACRALLMRPLITTARPEQLRLVRRHQAWLTDTFRQLGYRLFVEPHAARLVKSAPPAHATPRPLRRPRTGAPFAPRGYALLVLTLAALSRARDQLLLSELVRDVRAAAAEAGIELDIDGSVADRRALHSALLVLIELGVMHERDGDLARFADDAAVLSLLDVDREVLRLLLSARTSATSRDDLLTPDVGSAASGAARRVVWQTLVEEPILDLADLDDDHTQWWRRNRNRERELIRGAFGLEVELRAEGALAVDPDEALSDVEFPGRGTLAHAALLLLERLVTAVLARVEAVGDGPPAWAPVDDASVRAAHQDVVATHSTSFSKAYREDPDLLRRDATELLVEVGLLRPAPPPDGEGSTSGWLVHAAAARFRARVSVADADPSSLQETLWTA